VLFRCLGENGGGSKVFVKSDSRCDYPVRRGHQYTIGKRRDTRNRSFVAENTPFILAIFAV